eukprot:170401-Chlamydomonas_euryale.AAC.5
MRPPLPPRFPSRPRRLAGTAATDPLTASPLSTCPRSSIGLAAERVARCSAHGGGSGTAGAAPRGR